MTEHRFGIPGANANRTYLLEVNPNYVVRSTLDKLNVIDARWIDKSSGLFIDITAVRKDDERRGKGNPEALICKDKHRYDVWWLRSTVFPRKLTDKVLVGEPDFPASGQLLRGCARQDTLHLY